MEKKSFILYVDTAKQVDFLTDEEAGQLFKALFRYVSDGKEFVTDNRTLAIVFSAIKAQIDRDSKKYVEISNKRKEAANKKWSMNKSIQLHSLASNEKQMDANAGDNEYDNINDTINDNVINNDVPYENNVRDRAKAVNRSTFDSRKERFYHTLTPFVNQYGEEMIDDFFDYWTEPNKSGTKMRFEIQKTWDVTLRLRRWAAQDNKFNDNTYGNSNRYSQQPTPADNRRAAQEEIDREIAATIEAANRKGR